MENNDQEVQENEEEAIEKEKSVCSECDATITEENTCPKCNGHIDCTCKCDKVEEVKENE